jgi:nucleotide-binding universal stress UspA family protein
MMGGLSCIVAATDLSPAGDRAARRAAELTSSRGGVLQLIHVLPPRDVLAGIFPSQTDNEIAALRTRVGVALQERVHVIAASFAVTPSWTLLHGRAHRAILDATAKFQADLIVVGAQGEHGAASSTTTVGETAFKLAQQSQIPVLLVRREPSQPYHTVMACAKGERIDNRVIEWANRLSPDSLLHLASAYTVPYEERLREWGASESSIDLYATRERDERIRRLGSTLGELRMPAARARLHVERGMPLQLILNAAAQFSADLIIVGRRHPPDPLGGGAFGSVARGVAILSPADVLIVPPQLARPTANGVAPTLYDKIDRRLIDTFPASDAVAQY